MFLWLFLYRVAELFVCSLLQLQYILCLMPYIIYLYKQLIVLYIDYNYIYTQGLYAKCPRTDKIKISKVSYWKCYHIKC